MNPDAEETITERYRNAKVRLRNDLKDQLQTRMETLDEHHESLEYARELVELCGVEAKVNMCIHKPMCSKDNCCKCREVLLQHFLAGLDHFFLSRFWDWLLDSLGLGIA